MILRRDVRPTPRSVRCASASARRAALVAAVLMIRATGSAFADDFRYDPPLHPLLCDAAIAAAQHARRFGAEDECDLLLLAEGAYCIGLRDDSRALDVAMVVLERAIEQDPRNVHARLQLAGAVWKRCRDASRVRALLEDARRDVSEAAVGAAREEVAQEIAVNLGVVATEEDSGRGSGGGQPCGSWARFEGGSVPATAEFSRKPPCARRFAATDEKGGMQ